MFKSPRIGCQITVSAPLIFYEFRCLSIFDGCGKEKTLSGVGIEDWVDESNTLALVKRCRTACC